MYTLYAWVKGIESIIARLRKLDIRKYAFSQRTINEWNRLPGECVNATSVNKIDVQE